MDHSAFNHITTFIFDVDGVFTNSEVLVTESGELLRTMNVRDGQAVKLALEKGYHVGIITKGMSIGVRRRFEVLGIKYIFDKVQDKITPFREMVTSLSLIKEEILYIGDDVPDIDLYSHCGIAATPADGSPDNLLHAGYICHHKGGQGCVREVIEKVMRIQKTWPY